MAAFTLHIPTPEDFNLPVAACSHGFVLCKPNKWTPVNEASKEEGALKRPLRLQDDSIVNVVIRHSKQPNALAVEVDRRLSDADASTIIAQVKRMLRLGDKDSRAVRAFQEMHAQARQAGWGRVFRSPTLFEDCVKAILLCNCGWGRTLAMNEKLCEVAGGGAFPSPAQLAGWEAPALQKAAGLGYRAASIISLSRLVVEGGFRLEGLEDIGETSSTIFKQLCNLPGLGPFTAGTLLQTLGHFERVPCDTETLRHIRHVHGISCTPANVQVHAQKVFIEGVCTIPNPDAVGKCTCWHSPVYEKYAPYQFLAFWMEIWNEYEATFGSFASMGEQSYSLITGHNMRKLASERSPQQADSHSGADGAVPPVTPPHNLACTATPDPLSAEVEGAIDSSPCAYGTSNVPQCAAPKKGQSRSRRSVVPPATPSRSSPRRRTLLKGSDSLNALGARGTPAAARGSVLPRRAVQRPRGKGVQKQGRTKEEGKQKRKQKRTKKMALSC